MSLWSWIIYFTTSLSIISGLIINPFLWDWWTFCGRQKRTWIHLLIIILIIPEVLRLLNTDFRSLASELLCNISSYGDSSQSLSPSDLEIRVKHIHRKSVVSFARWREQRFDIPGSDFVVSWNHNLYLLRQKSTSLFFVPQSYAQSEMRLIHRT